MMINELPILKMAGGVLFCLTIVFSAELIAGLFTRKLWLAVVKNQFRLI
jgi:hypothetical protein